MLSKEEVQHIATLARISLTDKEIEKFQKELGDILDYFKILEKVDVSQIQPMTHSVLLDNIKREDIAHKEASTDDKNLIDMAPEKKDGYLKVKSIL